MNQQRPINLNLGSLKYPPTAVVSILHRISGILLFILLPLVLYVLNLSLQSKYAFDQLQVFINHPHIKIALWAFTSAFVYHLLAGIRHIILDMGFGEDIHSGKRSAVVVIAVAGVIICLLGMWIW